MWKVRALLSGLYISLHPPSLLPHFNPSCHIIKLILGSLLLTVCFVRTTQLQPTFLAHTYLYHYLEPRSTYLLTYLIKRGTELLFVYSSLMAVINLRIFKDLFWVL